MAPTDDPPFLPPPSFTPSQLGQLSLLPTMARSLQGLLRLWHRLQRVFRALAFRQLMQREQDSTIHVANAKTHTRPTPIGAIAACLLPQLPYTPACKSIAKPSSLAAVVAAVQLLWHTA